MIARARRISLRNGIDLDTPVLIPGLSSMAMGPIPYATPAKPNNATPQPCSVAHSDLLLGGWEDAILLSAYDIYHDLLTDASSIKCRFEQSRYARHDFLMIDSGWYEKQSARGGIFFAQQTTPLVWTEEMYRETVDSLSPTIRAIVVNWDAPHPDSYESQIQRAQEFFGDRDRFASSILLKPPATTNFHDFGLLSDAVASRLRVFDVIGVTEKELGDSILSRLVALAQLRTLLDRVTVHAPIHVFGSLDPLYCPLMFAAGGELFDGLGWLRYAYQDGLPLYREVGPLIDGQIDKRWLLAQTSIQLNNLDALRALRSSLRVFIRNDGDWTKIPTGVDYLQGIFERFDAELGGPNGG